jgi:hypothetical protein
MNAKRIISVLLLLAGEVLIIFCFLHFGKNFDKKVLTLDIIISSIIYLLCFIDMLFPLINLKDKSQKVIGSIGLRWFFIFFYMLIAIAAMIIFTKTIPLEITSLYLIHGILFFLLCVGLYFALQASQKVNEVFQHETQIRGRVEEMRKATKEVMLKLDRVKDIRSDVTKRVTVLYENLRFITPSDNRSAYELETDYLNEIKSVKDCLFEIPYNYDKIFENIENCERTYKERKQVLSN